MSKDNEQVDALGQTLDAGASTFKDVDGFLEKILAGILRHIFSIMCRIPGWIWRTLRFICTTIWKITRYITVKIFKNFTKIFRFLYRLLKLSLILSILGAIILWPLYFGVPFLCLWLIFVVVPGIYLGIRIWYVKYKKRKSDEKKANEAVAEEGNNVTEFANNPRQVKIIEPYILENNSCFEKK